MPSLSSALAPLRSAGRVLQACAEGEVRTEGTASTVRRRRMVVALGALAMTYFSGLAVILLLLGMPLASAVAGLAVAVTAGALGWLRFGARPETVGAAVCMAIVSVSLVQASLDAGILDPVLIWAALSPLAAALVVGPRWAAVCAGLAAAGALALFLAPQVGVDLPRVSSELSLSYSALASVMGGAVFTAVAGMLYDRHTRGALQMIEAETARLDAALRASEARYQSLFDHVPLGVYRTAPDGTILLANRAMAGLVGVPNAQAALGRSARDYYDDPTARVRLQEAVAEAGAVHRFETGWRMPDGQRRSVRIDARAEYDEAGTVRYYEGIVQDVTAEARAREALHQNEARFRALVQRSSDVVVVLDAEGSLTYVSPSVEGLLGIPFERLLGSSAYALLHPDDRTAVRALLSEAVSGGAASQREIRFRHADGHHVFADVAGTPLFDDPVVGGLVLNLRDATERKRAQAVLVHAKRQAEEVARLKSTFVANMSHEIRTPLTAILGFADVLSDEVDDPEQQEFVELISRSGRRLMNTLNSVLDLARLESGRAELSLRLLDVGEAVAETARLLQPVAADRGLTLDVRVEGRGLHAELDEAAFDRVLTNLIGNALKFTERGGVALRVWRDAGRVEVEVRDTGIGIAPEFLPRLFGEFEQASSGTGRTHDGAGLGLAISRQLAEQMGGTIGVESTVGLGSTFTLAFPAVGLEGEAVEAPPAELPLALVVDDNEQARLVAEMAVGARFRVRSVAWAEEALAAAEAEPPDVVVLDIHLGPTASGEDVMRRLRDMPTCADVPIIAVTAYALPGDRTRFLQAGFDEYVPKPYTRDQLLRAVDDAVRARRPQDTMRWEPVSAA